MIVGAAVGATLVTDVAVLLSGRLEAPGRPATPTVPRNLVSVAEGAAPPPPVVAPLTERRSADLLIAGKTALPGTAVERARDLQGVAGVTVVDAANAEVGGRRLGLLGVDPSQFRAFTPRRTAESDQLWRTVASGGMAVSFELSRGDALPLGTVVPAGERAREGRVRVGAYASLGIEDVDAVVSRERARALGLPNGNGLLVSAPKADLEKLAGKLEKVLPDGTKVAPLRAAEKPRGEDGRDRPRVTGRPDGASGDSTPITGNRMTPTMRTLLLEVNSVFGPFPTIGCFRSTADPQDHGDGRACDFMETTGGRTPSASALRHGDQVAAYTVANARRLGVSYVIWRQRIWNIARAGEGWRPMEDRGSLTQNHYDHVHISVLR
ncbi:hypothetical protein [Actinomadura algeriensis]|uniref:ARB-07466-like C-terminal domain-containing protein n=1 Tax=Actinomadura algeriensis TaxID=1679523 RepID=A0ABR9JYS7_9ACTN|nr:hypothetical protein [Actinomadura algeriensis]MBE1535742.1 hypothetical protein [Actinomadura algeriensis]